MLQKTVNIDTPDGVKKIAYTEWGSETQEHAVPVFCVHGLSRNSRDFDFVADALSKDRKVYCIDIVGRGESEWFNDSALYAYPAYINLCLSFLNQLNLERVDWLGTSMGGLIGMFVASQKKNPIRKLVLNDIGPFIPRSGLLRIGEYVGKDIRFQSLSEAENYLREICTAFGPLTESQWHHLAVHGFKQNANRDFVFKYDPAIAAPFAGDDVDDIDLTAVWYLLSQPTLVLRGTESDLLLKTTALDMAENPDCTLVEFEGIGHAPMLMSQEQIRPILEFLKK